MDGLSQKMKIIIMFLLKNMKVKKKCILDTYLHRFMKDNFDINKIISNNNGN